MKPNFFTHGNATTYLRSLEKCSQCKRTQFINGTSRVYIKVVSGNNGATAKLPQYQRERYNKYRECKHLFTFDNRVLGNRSDWGLCVGCYRLHDLATGDTELMDIRRWVLNGDLPLNEFIKDSDSSSGFTELRERERLGYRLGSIKKRLRNLRTRSDICHSRKNYGADFYRSHSVEVRR